MKNLTNLKTWQALIAHQHDISNQHMRDWFDQDERRFEKFSLEEDGLFLDYSRNRITEKTISLLCDLANALSLTEKREALFNGSPVNTTEKRPALHTALRDVNHSAILVNGENIAPLINETQKKICALTATIHDKKWKGITGKPIFHIVNIGIGGSYLGPMMCTHALKDFAITDLKFHFISSVDKDHINEVLQEIDPETTLFIISSKSFSTLETITNADTIATWMKEKFGQEAIAKHFIAITAATEKASAFGIPKEHIFPLWDWIGGRYSIWSTIGLPLMLMIGEQGFANFMQGAYRMDKHFKEADFAHNMPVLLALLGIWYRNFFGASVQAIIPYAHRLRYLIPYLQQAEMESNGKNINLGGESITYATGSVIFGEEGCNGQHAYHQLLHQGQHLIPVDFILVGKPMPNGLVDSRHDILIASGFSQAQALMRGKTYTEAYQALLKANFSEIAAAELAPHQVVPGNRPSNVLFLDRITPKNLGALIALYEHKIFVQGAIWGINSFDQWGVELGKQLLPAILDCVHNQHQQSTDSATTGLINHFKKIDGYP
jgi:glucose-6-phosphate isomerase